MTALKRAIINPFKVGPGNVGNTTPQLMTNIKMFINNR